jgi:predicted dehydrogenase
MENLKVGILGTGFAKSVQIPGFINTQGFEIHSVYGRNTTKAKEIASQFQIPKTFEYWDELIEDSEVEVISVVSPVYLHYDMVLKAIDEGKHILCEKPMAMDLEESFTMWEELEKSELIGMINHEFRQYPERLYFNHLVQSNAIGKIFDVRIDMTANRRTSPNPRTWSWWSDVLHGGGLWGALGSHLIDFLQWTFGPVDRITGKIRTINSHETDAITNQPRMVTSDDSFWSLFELENGITGSMNGSLVKYGKSGTEFIAYGSKGSLMINKDNELHQTNDENEWIKVEIPQDYLLRPLKEGEGQIHSAFEKLLTHFRSGIEQKKSVSPSFEDGVNVQLVLDGLRKANARRDWINLLE